MNSYLIRVLIALVLVIYLVAQARATTAQPHRRRAFGLGAASLLAMAAYNGALAIDETTGPLQLGLAIAGVSLFAGAIVSLVLSFTSGELRGERARIATAAREFREQRERTHGPPNDES